MGARMRAQLVPDFLVDPGPHGVIRTSLNLVILYTRCVDCVLAIFQRIRDDAIGESRARSRHELRVELRLADLSFLDLLRNPLLPPNSHPIVLVIFILIVRLPLLF